MSDIRKLKQANRQNSEIADVLVDNLEYVGSKGFYKPDEIYRPFTIYGNDDNDKLSVLPTSTTGSLSSIITTSIASSNDRHAGGDDGRGYDDDDDGDDKIVLKNGEVVKLEKWWQTTIQISVPFFIAGIGTIGAGVILGRVEHWKVFQHISELFILVPALLGLKGNLDMCLASRLSTQANLGHMKSRADVLQMVIGNIALVQVQAIVAAFLVSLFAIGVGAGLNNTFEFDHAVLLTASAMFTATSSCFVLDFVLVAVILLAHRYKLNPDNLATPLAASIGDVVSLSCLAFISSLLFEHLATHLWVCFLMIAIYFLLLPFWIFIVLRNKYTRPVLKSGWVPVLSALLISGMGGLVLDTAQGDFNGFVVFQPIINGIGGNLVSIQASKISTMLHQSSILGIIPPHTKIWENPFKALFRGSVYAKTARILILISIPGQIIFIFVADIIHMSSSTIGALFVLSYITVSFVQIVTLLYIAHFLIHSFWKWKIDPDNTSIPYLTSLGDLFGSSLLLGAFAFLRAVGHEYGIAVQDTIGEISDAAFDTI